MSRIERMEIDAKFNVRQQALELGIAKIPGYSSTSGSAVPVMGQLTIAFSGQTQRKALGIIFEEDLRLPSNSLLDRQSRSELKQQVCRRVNRSVHGSQPEP